MRILRIRDKWNEKLPYVHGKVVFLRVEQSKKIKKNRRHLAVDILSKIMFDENLAISLILRISLSITKGFRGKLEKPKSEKVL